MFLETETNRPAVIIRRAVAMVHPSLDLHQDEMMTMKAVSVQATTMDMLLVVAPSALVPTVETEARRAVLIILHR